MANNYYQLYMDSVFSLAYTISVKFEQAADAINNKVMMEYGLDAVDKYDPSSWRYYQNISGSYHFLGNTSVSTNSDIQITSLDTLSTIAFTKNNLLQHPATKAAYSYGSVYYNELINRYPDDELLIRGILYPCNIDTAINAPDGTILSYPADLVESNEYHFIEKLQDWIYDYLTRWVNKQYEIAHDLYVPMYMSQFYMHLIPAIINIRLQSCKTPEAHSYHVRQYLASNLMLDKYLSYLTKEQSLFFYRNIDYIKSNAGKREVFDWLVDNIMTKRGLPIYSFDAKHDVSKVIASEDNNYAESDRHSVSFRRLPINYPTVDPKRNVFSTQEVLAKINTQAPGNPEYHKYEGVNIERSLVDYRSNSISTKLLESAITDYSQAVPYPLSDTLLNEWLSMSFSNRYNSYVTIEFPISKEQATLPVKDAFILFCYCALKYRGLDVNSHKKIIASRVLKQQLPTLQWMLNYFSASRLTAQELNAVYLNCPPTTSVGSINGFYERAYGVFNLNLQHFYAESSVEHYITAGELKVANTQLFEDRVIEVLPSGVSYEDWLSSLSYDFTNYTDTDYLNLGTVVYERATGSDINRKIGIKEIQKVMVNLFLKLSSYSIQLIDNASTSPLYIVSDPSVKVGDIDTVVYDSVSVEVSVATVIGRGEVESERYHTTPVDNQHSSVSVESEDYELITIQDTVEHDNTRVENDRGVVYVEFQPLHVGGADYEEEYNALSEQEKYTIFNLSF